MAKNRTHKEAALQQLDELLESKGVVFFNYGNLKMQQFEELRQKLRDESGKLAVAKRRLLLLALKNKHIAFDENAVSGAVAVAVGNDEVTPAKVVATFKKDNDQVELYGGLLERAFIDKSKVEHMATLPTKPELLAKMVGSLNAPLSGMVNVLAGNLRGLVNVLNAIKDKK